MAFSSLFSTIGAKLFGSNAVDTADGDLVDSMIEAIIDAVDPRLRMISGYRGQLAPGVARTIAHLRTIARELPEEPVKLSPSAWGSDLRLNALFATSADVNAVLGRSSELREFFEAPVNAARAEAYGLLGMFKTERHVLAPAIVDGMLRHDVSQTTVNFGGHKLIAVAGDYHACRLEVGTRILNRLAVLALERITAIGEHAVALEQRKALLAARLRLLNLRKGGIEGLGDEGAAEIVALEKELKTASGEHAEAKASLSTLATRLGHVTSILDAPADYLSLAKLKLRLNKMGFKVAPGSEEPASELKLHEFSMGDGLKAVILFVRCQRAELPPRESLLARAAREIL